MLRSDPFRYNDDEPIDKISRALAQKAKVDADAAASVAAAEIYRRAEERIALLHATDDDYPFFDHTARDLDDKYPFQSHTAEPEAAYPPPDERYTALMREPTLRPTRAPSTRSSPSPLPTARRRLPMVGRA